MLDALVELLDVVPSHLADLDSSRPSRSVRFVIPADKADAFTDALSELKVPTAADDDETSADPDRAAADLMTLLTDALGDEPETLRRLGYALERAASPQPDRTAILNGALLAMAVGAFETLVAGVAAQHFRLFPTALGQDDKEFSLSDLDAFENIADARDVAIARRVDKLMRPGYEEWSKWFKGRLSVNLDDLAMSSETVTEVLQRRHVVIHNAGRASRQYLSKVSSAHRQDTSVGDQLVIDRPYLLQAIDELAVLGNRLALLAWASWKPKEEGLVCEDANTHVFELLSAKRWAPARCISATCRTMNGPEVMTWNLHCNEWQAAKRMDGPESIRDAVEEWDTSALVPIFSAAKAALLDKHTDVFELLPQLVATDQISLSNVETWPIFAETRADEGWPEAHAKIQEADQTKSSSDEDDGPRQLTA
jgi:hypothetical protein